MRECRKFNSNNSRHDKQTDAHTSPRHSLLFNKHFYIKSKYMIAIKEYINLMRVKYIFKMRVIEKQ